MFNTQCKDIYTYIYFYFFLLSIFFCLFSSTHKYTPNNVTTVDEILFLLRISVSIMKLL